MWEKNNYLPRANSYKSYKCPRGLNFTAVQAKEIFNLQKASCCGAQRTLKTDISLNVTNKKPGHEQTFKLGKSQQYCVDKQKF